MSVKRGLRVLNFDKASRCHRPGAGQWEPGSGGTGGGPTTLVPEADGWVWLKGYQDLCQLTAPPRPVSHTTSPKHGLCKPKSDYKTPCD